MMVRIVKQKEFSAKRNEILDAAQRLVYTRGYENTSIQDILDELGISKGAFYHYFDSKQALLDGLIERMTDEAVRLLQPIVEADDLPAVEKLQRYLDAGGRWKTERKSFMLSLLRAWYTDSNVLVRQKQQAAAIKQIAPALVKIVRQGVAEGAFSTTFPEQIGNMLLGLSQGVADEMADLLLCENPPPDALERLESIASSYAEAMERILGAPAGSLKLADIDMLKEWLAAPADK